MSQRNTRWRRVTGVALGSIALVFTSMTAASANVVRLGNPPVISINVTTANGFSMPSHIHAGLVTFKVSSPDTTGHGIQGFYLNRGTTLAKAKQDVNDTLSGDPVRTVAGVTALEHDVTEVGVVSTNSYAPISVTIPMNRGTYYFLDVDTVDAPPLVPVYHVLHVTGQFRPSRVPGFSAVVGMIMNSGDMPQFIAPSSFAANGSYLAYVAGDEIHEAVFRPVVPGTTDAYITNFYNLLDAGQPTPASPWTGSTSGMQAMSPGRWAIVHIDLPPGPYALICYVPSDEAPGLAHAREGMHMVVTLH